MTNLLFEPPIGGVRGNVCTLCIARWKARDRLPICCNWTFVASYYSGQSRRFSKRGGSLKAQISGGRGHRPPTSFGVWKLDWLPFHVMSKFQLYVLSFCHKARMWRWDAQNYDPLDHASIAASRKKYNKKVSATDIIWLSWVNNSLWIKV